MKTVQLEVSEAELAVLIAGVRVLQMNKAGRRNGWAARDRLLGRLNAAWGHLADPTWGGQQANLVVMDEAVLIQPQVPVDTGGMFRQHMPGQVDGAPGR